MKLKILIILSSLLFLISCKSEIYDISFNSDNDKLPSKIIFSEKYFNHNQSIFFINRDYQGTYSQLVEYDLLNKKIVKLIQEIDPDHGFIDEYHLDKETIVWSVLRKDQVYYADIYFYNINTKKLVKLPKQIQYSESNKGYFQLQLRIEDDTILWIEHDYINKESKIKSYNLLNAEITTLVASPFVNDKLKISIFFMDYKNNKIYFDKRTDKNNHIIIFDVIEKKELEQLDVDKNIIFHYTGSYNIKNNFLALYAKSHKEDIIYVYDISGKSKKSIVSFTNYSRIYDDVLSTLNNEIIYTVQRNISGMIKDHYYVETYNLGNYDMKQNIETYNFIKNEKYFGILKFVNGIKEVNFKLYKN